MKFLSNKKFQDSAFVVGLIIWTLVSFWLLLYYPETAEPKLSVESTDNFVKNLDIGECEILVPLEIKCEGPRCLR